MLQERTLPLAVRRDPNSNMASSGVFAAPQKRKYAQIITPVRPAAGVVCRGHMCVRVRVCVCLSVRVRVCVCVCLCVSVWL